MADSKLNLIKPMRSAWIDRCIISGLGTTAGVAILVTIGIVLSLLTETISFLERVPLQSFLLD